ncbi:MAG: beta-N-acetylhexosaminidase [Prevotellaceae bacterium]|jgi:hexosaminidase|nr:beta-N-acetylhexosaminidase [Prevotellaceae bacterium]
MKKLSVTLLASLSTLWCLAQVSIIPEPLKLTQGSGTFSLHDQVQLVAVSADELQSARYFSDYLKKHYNLSIQIVEKVGTDPAILFSVVEKETPSVTGEYELTIDTKLIVLNGFNPQGLFYAVQSLIQLIPAKGHWKLEIPAIYIYDKPAFSYRGMHFDVVRHIFPVEYIKKFIDYLALHKMNYFHWHLTDDQGWRIESAKYPKLNTIGAYREATIIGMFPGTGVDSTRYGGFYTVKELREVVDYAKARYITVIPEADIPAHCMAAISAYPQLSTAPDTLRRPASTWGIFNRQNNVLSPNKYTFKFLEDIFDELCDIFHDSPYIHFGADEASTMWWKESAESQEFMKQNNMTDEGEIQDYLVRLVVNTINNKGKIAVGWDEITRDPKLSGDVVVMNWRGQRGGNEAANKGYKVIMTPSRYSYLNSSQRPDEELVLPRRVTTLDTVYLFNPVPKALSPQAAENIIGGQGCMWTEYYPTISKVEYALFPRLSAIAENYWSGQGRKDLTKFKQKLSKQFDLYDLWGANYCNYVVDIGDVKRLLSTPNYLPSKSY